MEVARAAEVQVQVQVNGVFWAIGTYQKGGMILRKSPLNDLRKKISREVKQAVEGGSVLEGQVSVVAG